MRPCTIDGCDRPLKGRGLCNTHYQRARKAGTLPETWDRASTKGKVYSKGVPVRVLDLLETDGGWLTPAGIGLVIEGKPEAIMRALYRLRRVGLVESRTVPLARAWAGSAVDARQEWRAV